MAGSAAPAGGAAIAPGADDAARRVDELGTAAATESLAVFGSGTGCTATGGGEKKLTLAASLALLPTSSVAAAFTSFCCFFFAVVSFDSTLRFLGLASLPEPICSGGSEQRRRSGAGGRRRGDGEVGAAQVGAAAEEARAGRDMVRQKGRVDLAASAVAAGTSATSAS
eukprot:CAMPEP_0179933646 /NCGR_PEP_ID=MMETSP0983-20121128/11985_1 /TAXON_ID=483367 /ORGANISM="non described non described, Strain CCMP 2436" /LENGTH=167 /DNA_ID=CAMNT_0021838477 /DNA_START=864 /DNA_END=1364 /DNA_ORIENTATION=+